MRPEFQRFAAVALFVISVLGALMLIVPRWRQLVADHDELTTVQKKIDSTTKSVALLENAPKGPPFAHVPATVTEASEFEDQLGRATESCGVRLTNTRRVVATPTSSNASPADPSQKTSFLPVGIDPVILDLTIEGDYSNVALFFNRLESYPRLVSITDVTMNTAGGNQATTGAATVSAKFTMTRYTTPVSVSPS